MHMSKIHTVIRRTNDSDNYLVCVTYFKISDAQICDSIVEPCLLEVGIYLQYAWNARILWYRNISEQSVTFFLMKL